MVAETEKGKLPKNSDWVELHKSDVEVDKGRTTIHLNEKSGMKALYDPMASAITLQGTPEQASVYPVTLDMYDIYGRHAKSNEAWFQVADPDKTYLDKVLTDVDVKLVHRPNGKVLWYQEPWYITNFNENKTGREENVVLNKNINLWYGSRESGVYGVLGKIVPLSNKPDKEKGEVHPWEDRIPYQNLILKKGTNLTLAYMKISSGVNIIVEEGAILNLYDSSLYGKVTVNGGTVRVNYNPGRANEVNDEDYNKVLSATSIQGQIILNDGAILEDSAIYSNTNNLTDANMAVKNIRPVVLVKGKAFIKGNVYVKGDEAPSGEDQETQTYYRGQNAMTIDGGSLTIADNSTLYLYGGGTSAATSLGGNALQLKNEGKVVGEGSLVALGGTGHSNVAGYAVEGNGHISTKKAYLRAGNAYNSRLGEQKAVSEGVEIHNNVEGKVINTSPLGSHGDNDYDDYWNHSSVPGNIPSEKIGSSVINTQGKDKIEGEPVPEGPAKPNYNGPKRVDFTLNQHARYSIDINSKSDGSKAWLAKIESGEAIIKVGDTVLSKTQNENEKGYQTGGSALYVYGLDIGDKVSVEVEGYQTIKLEAEKVDGYVKYRLVEAKAQEDKETPINPSEEVEITDEAVERARVVVKTVAGEIEIGKLELSGVNTDRNRESIENFKKAIEKAKELATKDPSTLTKKEKEELVRFAELKDGKYSGFADYTKNILVDLQNGTDKKIPNKHHEGRLHVKLKSGKTTYRTKLAGVTKDKYPKLDVYYITKDEYDKTQKVDTVTGATPLFEDHVLHTDYYDVNTTKEGYELSVNEAEMLKSVPNIKLLKVVFRVKLADGVYVENKDFVFLSNEGKDSDNKPDSKPENKPDKETSNIESVSDSNFKKDGKEITDTKTENRTGHYVYKRVAHSSTEKVAVKSSTTSYSSYIEGYPDNTFKAEGKTTRAEAATMLMKLNNAQNISEAKPNFKDTEDGWYNKAINYATQNNMLLSENNLIRPNDAITRAEFARMLMPLLKDSNIKAPFKDIEGNKFEKAINIAYSNKIIKGYPDGTFKPYKDITRAEIVTMINRLENINISESELLTNKDKIITFKDLSKNHWAYYEIMAATNYSIVNNSESIKYVYKPKTYYTWEEKWVWDTVPTKPQVPSDNEFKDLVLKDKEDKNKVEVSGNIQVNSKVIVEEKSQLKNGKTIHILPRTIFNRVKQLKTSTDKDYEVIKSYDVSITGKHEGNLSLTFNVGAEYNGKKAIVLHLLENGNIERFDEIVKEGKISLTVNQLSPFTILIEEDKPVIDQGLEQAKEKLQNKIEELKKIESKDFTEVSFENLQKALEQAEKIAKDSKDKSEIENAIKSLDLAKEGLEEKKVEENLEAEKAKLQEEITAFGAIVPEKHTKKSYEAYKEEVEKAEALLQEQGLSKEKLNTQIQTLLEAKNSLEKRGDTTTLEGKIAEAKELVENTNYTEATRNVLKEYLRKYDNFEADKVNYTEKNVTDALAEIKEEIAKLEQEAPVPPVVEGTKKVKFVPGNSFFTRSITIDKEDQDSKAWLGKLQQGQGKVTLLPKENLEKVTNDSDKGYMTEKERLNIYGITKDKYILVEVEGYEKIYLKSEDNGWRSYVLKKVEESQVPEDMKEKPSAPSVEKVQVTINFKAGEEQVGTMTFESEQNKTYTDEELFKRAKNLENYEVVNPQDTNEIYTEDITYEIAVREKTTLETKKKVKFVHGNSFFTRSITIDKEDQDSKAWLGKLQQGQAKVTLLAKEKLSKVTNDADKGYMTENERLNICGITKDKYILVEVEGYEKIYLKSEDNGWRSYVLKKVEEKQVPEELKGNTSTPSDPETPPAEEDLNLKEVKFKKSIMNVENTLNIDGQDFDTKAWLDKIENGQAEIKSLATNEKLVKVKYSFEKGYKLADQNLMIYGLKAGEYISIKVQGYRDIYLELVKTSFGYNISVIEKSDVPKNLIK